MVKPKCIATVVVICLVFKRTQNGNAILITQVKRQFLFEIPCQICIGQESTYNTKEVKQNISDILTHIHTYRYVWFLSGNQRSIFLRHYMRVRCSPLWHVRCFNQIFRLLFSSAVVSASTTLKFFAPSDTLQ